ncbi:hypothetical protein QRD02_02105 [Aequorivita sp. SDUM287046]|uniref:Uncharacterized protein n=1 Tax=Aequorivita aurantiaca TaxID=3053356 RepID=A0ABT8DEL7_9FLAO|nr:hypothetical protein [Aequorivita aurantiaca]MDN3723162.1 hypothetical protein [Aequorivita aurantiaca]
MSKNKKEKSEKKKHFKTECCEKYLKKGEHKRCKRCPSFDLSEAIRLQRLQKLQLDINTDD